MKKWIAMLLTLTMMLSLCSFAVAESGTTLTVACWDLATTPYYEAIKTAYESTHEGVTIEWVDLASQDYNIKASTMLSGGDTTDVFIVKELSDLQNWAKEGFVVNLNDRIAADGYDMSKYAGMDRSYVLAGTDDYYALPFRADFWVMFYNKTLFDKAGVELPTNDMTWDAYKDLAIKMTGDGVYGTHYHTWLSAAVNWAVCDGVNSLADGEYSDLKYFYQMVQDLEDAGACMTYDELKASGLHYSGAFAQGNIAMMPMGYWYAATLINYIKDGTADFEWGIAAVPHLEGVAAGSSFGSPTGISVNSKSANVDAAWDFISWVCGEEGAKAVASTGTRPAYVSEDVAAAMTAVEGFPQDDTTKAALLPTAIAMEWPIGDGVSEIKTIVNEEHTLIMTRELSIDDGIAEMEERAAEFVK